MPCAIAKNKTGVAPSYCTCGTRTRYNLGVQARAGRCRSWDCKCSVQSNDTIPRQKRAKARGLGYQRRCCTSARMLACVHGCADACTCACVEKRLLELEQSIQGLGLGCVPDVEWCCLRVRTACTEAYFDFVARRPTGRAKLQQRCACLRVIHRRALRGA